MATYYRRRNEPRGNYGKNAFTDKTSNMSPIVHKDQTSLRWQKLLRYYNACISIENVGEVTLYSSQEGTDFLQVPAMEKEWIASGKERLEFDGQNEKIQAFISGSRWSKSSISYFYGYPCGKNCKFVQGVKSSKTQSSY